VTTPDAVADAAPDTATAIGFGVIGANSFVANAAVLPAIVVAPNARLVAAASRSGSVDSRWADTEVDDYDAVLEHPEVHAVYIPLPNGMHLEWARRAAAAGKHVLCEKPIAGTVADALAMRDVCSDAGVTLAEAWMTPFDARWSHAIEMARAGTIGEITHIDAEFTFTIGSEASDNYRWDPAQGGGALLDVGIYCLGAPVALWGSSPESIDAEIHPAPSGVDASASATLMWSGGQTARITCSFVDDEAQRLELVGSTGSLVLDGDAHTGGSAAIEIEHHTLAGTDMIRVEPNDPYQAMVEAFASSLHGEAQWPRPVSDCIDLLELVERIRKAAS